MKCPYGLQGTRASSHDRSSWLLELDCNEMPLWRLHCTRYFPYGIVIRCPYGLHRMRLYDQSPWLLNKDCNEMPLLLFALYTSSLMECNKLPLWRFALNTLFPLVGLLKCPYGLHSTRASSHDQSPWLLEHDCNEMPLWRFALYAMFPCGTVMKCPYGLHSTCAPSHDWSPWLLELDCNDATLM
jgi:hypothetical protein